MRTVLVVPYGPGRLRNFDANYSCSCVDLYLGDVIYHRPAVQNFLNLSSIPMHNTCALVLRSKSHLYLHRCGVVLVRWPLTLLPLRVAIMSMRVYSWTYNI